ncbi:MAG: hypothetical protein R2856_13790 [Caldilineaceae bacterium]
MAEVASGPYNITGAEVVLNEKSEALIRRFFGDKTELRSPIPGYASPLSTEKARKAFGYAPEHVWSQRKEV